MNRRDKDIVLRRKPLPIPGPLTIGLVALLAAGVLEAATHKKKQAELSPNLIGDTTPTADGTLVRFAGIPNFTYAIQGSSDGTNWTTITTLTAPANGLMKYLGSDTAAAPLFYRTTAQ